LPLGDEGGFVQLALNWKNNEAASRSVPSRAQYIYQPTVTTVGGVTTVTPDPRDATADRYYWGSGYGPGEEDILAASYNAELPWKDLTLYSTSTLSHRSSKKNTGSFLPNLAPVAGVTSGRPQNRNSLPEVYPNGFNALRRIFELDFQTTLGARGLAKGWDWDLSTTFAQDHAQLDGAEHHQRHARPRQSDLFPPVDPPVPAVDHQSRRHPRVRRFAAPSAPGVVGSGAPL
jgi:iron complex outermembrane receptor protein